MRYLPLLALAATALPAFADPALTIYNQNFAVVRDTVPLELKAGVTSIPFSGVTAHLEPDSVILRDSTGKSAINILEQTYRNDPVSEGLMLSLNEGQTIEFAVSNQNKPDQIIPGKIIRSGYVPPSPENGYMPQGSAINQPVIEVNGKLQFFLPGRPLFPALAGDSILKPTLIWQIKSGEATKLNAELSYVTTGMSWEADYNLVSPEKGDQLDVVGWITVKNETGMTFPNAGIKLMAGDVQKIQPPMPMMVKRSENRSMMAGMAMDEEAVTEKAFDEFHLYSLPRPTTLRDRETKQVEFIRAVNVAATRLYIYDGAMLPHGWRAQGFGVQSPEYGNQSNKKVNTFIEFKNSKENQLGMALPAGRMRFYRKDGEQLQFTGENKIDHTAKDETIRLHTGDSFDLVGERKRTKFKTDGSNRWADEAFEIKVRNHKTEPVEIRVVEHLYRGANWQIRQKSHPFEQKDSQTVEFKIPLKPDEEVIVTYEVHYTW